MASTRRAQPTTEPAQSPGSDVSLNVQRWRIVVIWLATRLYIAVVGLVFARGILTGQGPLSSFAESWNYFDTKCYETIAKFGYLGSDACTSNTTLFPGLPGLMRAGSVFGLSASATGLLVSLAASLFAAWALAQLAKQAGTSPEWTVAAWLVAPMAVFLFAPYTEALFAALSFWAWVWARRGNWWVAGILAGLAGFVRSNALFLGLALIVLFILSKPRRWSDAVALLLPFITVAMFFGYLWALTGDWLHWIHMQSSVYNRQFTDPLSSSWNTISMALHSQETGFAASRFIGEFATTAITIGLGVVVLAKKWWAEAVYVFVTMWSMTTGEFLQSTPRAALILFPIWLVVGIWISRFRALRWTYLPLSAAALTVVVSRYVQGQWIS